MKKYIIPALICLSASSTTLASVGSGFYLSAGVGAGWVDHAKVTNFDLDYPLLYATFADENIRRDMVNAAYNDTVQMRDDTEGVVAGRAAMGYLWQIFDGEPTQKGNSIYTVNATIGLEVGYRIFDSFKNKHTEVEEDTINPIPPDDPFNVYETVKTDILNQAIDVTAVVRLPLTESKRTALLLKGGVAYNIYDIDTEITIEANTNEPPDGYDQKFSLSSETHYEFLPTFGAGLEYMVSSWMGVGIEYNAILGSSHDANSQLLMGNVIFRI